MQKKRSNLVNVGRVSGAFGVKGWVKIISYTEPVDNIVEYSPWWLKTPHGVKAISVEEHSFRGGSLVVRFDGVEDRDQAASFNLTNIAVERDQMPTLSDGEYYWHQLVGLRVVCSSGQQEVCLGEVKALLETGANDVLVVEPTDTSIDDRERLVPYVPDIYVREVDLDNEQISVDWDPEF